MKGLFLLAVAGLATCSPENRTPPTRPEREQIARELAGELTPDEPTYPPLRVRESTFVPGAIPLSYAAKRPASPGEMAAAARVAQAGAQGEGGTPLVAVPVGRQGKGPLVIAIDLRTGRVVRPVTYRLGRQPVPGQPLSLDDLTAPFTPVR